MKFSEDIPYNWHALKERVFDGEVFILPPSDASKAMVAQLHDVFSSVNGYDFTADIHKRKSVPDIMADLKKARTPITAPSFSIPLIHDIVGTFDGAADDDLIGDVLRLRAMPHEAHKKGLSPHSYSAHRDCWYANPQAQLNIWVPLLDVQEGNSFTFYPRYFNRAIANGSARFNYDDFVQKAGFQNTGKIDLSLYPVPLEDIKDNRAASFNAAAGAMVIFSPSHLHQTVLNECDASRFSVDFRVVSQHDIKSGKGAPNVDNRSSGKAEQDYYKVASRP